MEVSQLRRTNKDLEENLLRTEQRLSQLQKTLVSCEEGKNHDYSIKERFLREFFYIEQIRKVLIIVYKVPKVLWYYKKIQFVAMNENVKQC